MNELIKVTEKDGKQIVSARELYLGLGLDKSNWSRWSKANIEEDKFFKENEDWVRLKDDSDNQLVTNPNKVSYDYAICLEFAKHIAMMARTEKSYEYRNYFLECERIAKQQLEKALPKTFAEALQLAADQAKEIEAQQKLIAEQKPKVEFFDQVTDSKDACDMATVAKVLNMGVGRNKLFEILRDNKILQGNNQPMQRYVDAGWFRVIETQYTKPTGDICINFKTIVYQKGIEGIRKLLKEK